MTKKEGRRQETLYKLAARGEADKPGESPF